ncbi:LacI family DNA-binding transcriptional regulator [Streptomyces violarus]|uniref:LacI family DNA-binding transcriptional regulator n=1 Tax=Streptomyces violarus TaxID=67380 RepID=UPI0028F6E609|nr:LacI family DNA-binding transcriptional regulator [Streptomyces violarus]
MGAPCACQSKNGGQVNRPVPRYRGAMRRHRFIDRIRVLRGDSTEGAGESAGLPLLDGAELPTAVVAYHDRSAVGLFTAFRRAGVGVPGVLSVAGHDDDKLSRLACFDLATVSQNAGEQARRAVAAVVERLKHGRTAPREIVLTPSLVIRGTTAVAR